MTQDEKPTLDYADPRMPRPGKPPDGYLGFRDPEPTERQRFDWSTAVFAVVSFIVLFCVLVWLLCRWEAGAWG